MGGSKETSSNMEDRSWSPLPFPEQPSRFYSLRSIAWKKPPKVRPTRGGSRKLAPIGGSEADRLEKRRNLAVAAEQNLDKLLSLGQEGLQPSVEERQTTQANAQAMLLKALDLRGEVETCGESSVEKSVPRIPQSPVSQKDSVQKPRGAETVRRRQLQCGRVRMRPVLVPTPARSSAKAVSVCNDRRAPKSRDDWLWEPLVGHARNDLAAEEDEADIRMVRSNGVTLAHMMHPKGAEALVDLRGGLFFRWRLADGRTATASSMPPLWPDLQDASAWRLVLLDDSCNEPSATLDCFDVDGVRWRMERRVTVCQDSLREHVIVENQSCEEDLTFHVRELPYKEVVSNLPEGRDVSSMRPRRPDLVSLLDTSVVVPPSGRWTITVSWLAHHDLEESCSNSVRCGNRKL